MWNFAWNVNSIFRKMNPRPGSWSKVRFSAFWQIQMGGGFFSGEHFKQEGNASIDLRHAIDKIPNNQWTFFLDYSCGGIFSSVQPSIIENLHLYPLMALNNSVGPIWDHHLTFKPRLPLFCDFHPSTAFCHGEAALVAPLNGPEQLRGSNLRPPLKFLSLIAPVEWFSALYCLPPQRSCSCCTPWWPWTTPWVQFEITNELARSNHHWYREN